MLKHWLEGLEKVAPITKNITLVELVSCAVVPGGAGGSVVVGASAAVAGAVAGGGAGGAVPCG